MAGLRGVIIAAVLMAFILVATGEKHKHAHARQVSDRHQHHHQPCTNDPANNPNAPPCETTSTITASETTTVITTTDSTSTMPTSTSTSATESTSTSTSETESTLTSTSAGDSTSTPTALERAHWCRFNNGSYLSLGYAFMKTVCMMCQCTTSRMIRCQMLECLPTYCIDNSKPIVLSGQCCTQCAYDPPATPCLYNGVSFAHGAVIKTVIDKMQCWCHLGKIECRAYDSSLLQGLNLMNDGSMVIVIVIVLSGVLLVGLFICCCCTFISSYYYQKYQYTIQQAFDEYNNSGGWQPMGEEQNEADLNAEEKRLEAEKNQFSDVTRETMPPSYAISNNAYVPTDEDKPSQ
jgi:hypothetical protein